MRQRFFIIALCIVFFASFVLLSGCTPPIVLEIAGLWRANYDGDGPYVEGEAYTVYEFTLERFFAASDYKLFMHKYTKDGDIEKSYQYSWHYNQEDKNCYINDIAAPLILSEDKSTLTVPRFVLYYNETVDLTRVK